MFQGLASFSFLLVLFSHAISPQQTLASHKRQCSTWNDRVDGRQTSFFIPPHVTAGGDREFEGHGPNVSVTVNIYLSYDQRSLLAKTHMYAQETKSDWTTASGYIVETLYTAPAHSVIQNILGDVESSYSYTDSDHELDRPILASGELVKEFVIAGDTRGADAGVRTGVRAFFNPIWLELRQINNCS